MPPASTYRLQVRAAFTLFDVVSVLDYLTDLGVGAVYLSPLLRALSGSEHGYDVVDFTTIDPARGGAPGWGRLVTEVRRRPLQIVVDIVPNHVGVAEPSQNAAWWDVLRLGRDSRYAGCSTSTGRAAASGCRCSATIATPSPRCASSTASCATTTTAFRSRRARSRDQGDNAPRGPRPAALRAGRLAAGRHGPELPPVLRRQQPGRDPGRGPGGLR